jgi:hypothetical protein
MNDFLHQLSQDQIAYVEDQVASGKFSDPIACVKTLIAEAIQLRARKEIEDKLLVAVDQYERGECTEWTKEDRRSSDAVAGSDSDPSTGS